MGRGRVPGWRVGLLGILASLAIAAPAGVAVAGVTGQPPRMDSCKWWPGRTTVHWDRSWLLSVYRSNFVSQVSFVWPDSLGPSGPGSRYADQDKADATTPLGAQTAYAVLTLGNGQTVVSDTVNCQP